MIDTTDMPTGLDELAHATRVLGDATRLRLFNLLMEGTFCNCELCDALGLAPNLISHHLAVLRREGMVETRRDPLDSRWIYYSVNREALADLASALHRFFDPARIGTRVPQCGPSSGRNDLTG
jgi:ArsR family transcriptional regulator